MNLKELERKVRKEFPPESYGVKGAFDGALMEIDSSLAIKVQRDQAETKQWWDCLDSARRTADLTQGQVIVSRDTRYGLYHECHFVCNAEVEGKLRCIDGTPLFPFAGRRDWFGTPYEGEQEWLQLSKGLTPFSFEKRGERMYHSLLHLITDVSQRGGLKEGMHASYVCILIEEGEARQLVGRSYECKDVRVSHEFKLEFENLFRIKPYSGLPLFMRRRGCDEVDEGLLEYSRKNAACAQRFMKRSAELLGRRIDGEKQSD